MTDREIFIANGVEAIIAKSLPKYENWETDDDGTFDLAYDIINHFIRNVWQTQHVEPDDQTDMECDVMDALDQLKHDSSPSEIKEAAINAARNAELAYNVLTRTKAKSGSEWC